MSDGTTFHDYPPESVTIAYLLEQHGWASLNVRVGGSEVEIGSVGYCTDALGDLVRAAVAIATGAMTAQVIFDGEPTLWGIVIQDGWQSALRPQSYRFSVRSRSRDDGTSPSQVSSWSDVVAEGYITADAFAMAVSEAAHLVLTEHGEEGYLARWDMHPFPARALVALDAALAAPPQPSIGSPLSA